MAAERNGYPSRYSSRPAIGGGHAPTRAPVARHPGYPPAARPTSSAAPRQGANGVVGRASTPHASPRNDPPRRSVPSAARSTAPSQDYRSAPYSSRPSQFTAPSRAAAAARQAPATGSSAARQSSYGPIGHARAPAQPNSRPPPTARASPWQPDSRPTSFARAGQSQPASLPARAAPRPPARPPPSARSSPDLPKAKNLPKSRPSAYQDFLAKEKAAAEEAGFAPQTPPFDEEDEDQEVAEEPLPQTPPFDEGVDELEAVEQGAEEAEAEQAEVDEFPQEWDVDEEAQQDLNEEALEEQDAINGDGAAEEEDFNEAALADEEVHTPVDEDENFEGDPLEEPQEEEAQEEEEVKRQEDLKIEEVAEHLRDAVEGSMKLKKMLETEDDGRPTKRRKLEEDDDEEGMRREMNPQKLALLRKLQLEQDGVSRYVIESAETAEVEALSQSGYVPNKNHKQKRSLGEQLGQRLDDIREQAYPHGNKIDPVAAFGFRWGLTEDQIKLLDVLSHKDLRFVIREYDGTLALQDIIDDARSSDPGDGHGAVAAERLGSVTLGRFNRLELIDPLSDALVVGDANLTFSLLLAQHRKDLGHTGQTLATTFEQVPTLRERYKEIDETIKELQDTGAQVLHNVDCTRLGVDSRFQGMEDKFGAVYYNYPHAGAVRGFFDNHPFVRWRHANLMHLFFRALRNFVKPGASVKVSSNRRAQGVRYSDIFGAAQLNEFVHVETVPFPEWTLRKYGRSYGDKRDVNKRLGDGEIYAAQQASFDMVYCFCYAPSGEPLAKPHVRCPPTKRDLMSANEGALRDLYGERKTNKVEELTQLFLSYVQGIHVG